MSKDMDLEEAISVVLEMADKVALKAENLEEHKSPHVRLMAVEERTVETALRLVAQAASPAVPIEVELEVRQLIKRHRHLASRFAARSADTRCEVAMMHQEFAEEEHNSAEALATLLRIAGVNPDE